MIKQVRFQNWKSFRDATLHIDPLTILIGTNASGKSNALDGLEFLSRIAGGKEFRAALDGDAFLPPIRGGSEWAVRKPNEAFTLHAIFDSNSEEFSYKVSIQTQPEFHLIENGLLSNSTTLSQNEKNLIMFASFPEVFILNPMPQSMREYSPLSESLNCDASNIAGLLADLELEHKEKFEKTIATYAARLPEHDIRRVWAEPVGRFGRDAMLYCEEGWSLGSEPMIVDARGMSDGTLRFIAILTALLTRPPGSLLVIEDVDSGLHPSRAGTLLTLLHEIGQERGIDVLVTTHNPALLDAMSPDFVPFVTVAHRDPETGESHLTPLDEIEELPKLLASGPIGQLATKGRIEQALARRRRRDVA